MKRGLVYINHGGHGFKDGSFAGGERDFVNEDIETAKNYTTMNIAFHSMDEYSKPIYPAHNIDIIDAWCYSDANDLWTYGPT